MYKNIGEKIKNLALATFIVEAIAAVIASIALLTDDNILTGILLLFFGPLAAWVSSWLMYGFGELIDKATAIEINIRGGKANTGEKSTKNKSQTSTQSQKNNVAPQHTHTSTQNNICETVVPIKGKKSYECPKCGSELKEGQKKCLCSRALDWTNIN